MMEHPILLFDGVCNFCNSAVNFVIRRDKRRVFRYAALQSDTGRRLLEQHRLSSTELDSFVIIYQGKAYKKTTAALKVAGILGGGWRLAGIFRVIPAGIRDVLYNLVARNRYRWFGKKESCMIPSPEVRQLFLD